MTPRLLNKEKTARYIGLSGASFPQKRQSLEATGFPKPIVTGDEFGCDLWDVKAIDNWIDKRNQNAFMTSVAANKSSLLADRAAQIAQKETVQ